MWRKTLLILTVSSALAACGEDALNAYCPAGYVLIDNTCVPECEEGRERVGDVCLAKCPEGMERDGTLCVCSDGKELVDAVCVDPCPANQVRLSGVCECADGFESDGNGGCLPICEPGELRVGDQCVTDCPNGYEQIGDACLPLCPDDTERVGTECLPVCPNGTERVGDECLLICGPGTERIGDECLPVCDAGQIRVGTDCVDPGSITGRVCDSSKGVWLQGLIVSVTLPDGNVASSLTGVDGSFLLESLPPGDYVLEIVDPAGGSAYFNVTVAAGAVTTFGPAECLPPNGSLMGEVCNATLGVWIQGATVSIDHPDLADTTTNQFGEYQFASVPPGTYTVTVSDGTGVIQTSTVTINPGQLTDTRTGVCNAADGSVQGRICGGDGYWLSGATVSTIVNGQARQTTTDANGYFTLDGLPPGNYVITVTKGSFSNTYNVTVLPDQPTQLGDLECIPPTTHIAVVTGVYDSVQEILSNLGFDVRHRYTNSSTPLVVDPNGYVDTIDGYGPGGHYTDPGFNPNNADHQFWLNGFLMDPVWMSQYDIIFFNCGIDDAALLTNTASSQALQNLRDFVNQGGSVYASDWASGVVEQAFPGRIKFDTVQPLIKWDSGIQEVLEARSRLGLSDDNLLASVVDPGLAATLNKSQVTVNLNLSQWVVMQPTTAQASDVRVLIKGTAETMDAAKCNIFIGCPYAIEGRTLPNTPLTVRFDYGQGRVLYTSVHNEGNNTPDLEAILNYIIFEL